MKTKYLSKIVAELVYGGHLSSLGFSSLVLTPLLLLRESISLPLLAIPYLMTQVVYSYNHSREIRYDVKSNPERAHHLQKTYRWAYLSPTVCGILLIVILSFTNFKLALFAAFLVAGGILYTDYLKSAATKLIPGFKTFYTSLFLALCVFTVPLFQRAPVTDFYVYFFIFVFLRACINTAFSDIKDIQTDAERGLKTIPVLLGKRATLYWLHAANLACLLVLLASVRTGSLPREALLLAVSVAYDLVYLAVAFSWEGRRLRNLSYVVADAELWLWPLMILAGRAISNIWI